MMFESPTNNVVAIFVLVTVIMISAVSVVYAKHESRKTFVQLQNLQTSRDAMDVHWGKLQLEQGAWTTHGRVEQIAKAKLNMETPKQIKIVVVRP